MCNGSRLGRANNLSSNRLVSTNSPTPASPFSESNNPLLIHTPADDYSRLVKQAYQLICIFFFLLLFQTELSGIKWRKLVYCELGGGAVSGHCGGGGSEPLEDPVLRSYSRCLAADILCVWRRVSTPRSTADMFEPGPPPPPPLSLSTSKELWIFWYGEEPDLGVLIAPELNTPGKIF